ncbi:MAG: hypothetical protein ABIK89_04990, partial [Planctomycetota bacterium]
MATISRWTKNERAMEIYYAWKAEKQAAEAAAASAAFGKVASAIESVVGPIATAIGKIKLAHASLVGSTEATAEDIAKAWAD